ncbi:MAG: DUF58 domain-containing protein [Clostridiales bacterium]|nr:DUF58 domain-containing protein [Clostridiales bacterium]
MWVQRLFFALVMVALLQVYFFRRWNLRSMTYKRYFTPDIVNEGETSTMVEKIRNAKVLPIPWIRIEAQTSEKLLIGNVTKSEGKQYHRSLFSIPPYTTITRRHKVVCPHRGYYHTKTVSISSGDLLGIGSTKYVDLPTDTVITVYPTLVPIEDIFNMKNSFSGDTVVRRWIVEDPFMIKGVRDYNTSDPQNRINWKATVRVGKLQVHDFDFTSDIKLMIALNVETDEFQWANTIDEPRAERGISIAASIAQYTLEHGIETGLISNGMLVDDEENECVIEPRSSEGQVTEVFTILSKLTLVRRQTFQTMLANQVAKGLTGIDYLIVTAFVDENIEKQISLLRDGGNNVEVLFVEPVEKDGERND